MRLYDMNTSREIKRIRARDVGWSVIDCAYSPDQRWIIYSSWWCGHAVACGDAYVV